MLDLLDIIFRTVVIFLTLLVLMRLLGKRQMGELELSELVVSILIADVASVPLQNPELPLASGLVPCVILFLCEYLLSLLTLKSVTMRRWFCGRPCFLIIGGVIQQRAMKKCRYSVDELAEELRGHDVNDIAAVQYAVLETDGDLNVILYPEHRPATAGDLKCVPEDDGYATVLISDGALLRRNLASCGKDEKWLRRELQKRGCAHWRQVYAFVLFESGKVFFAEKE